MKNTKEHPLVRLVRLKNEAAKSDVDPRMLKKIEKSISELGQKMLSERREEICEQDELELPKKNHIKILH